MKFTPQGPIYPRLRTTGLNLNSEMKYVKRTRLLNGYPKWMIRNKKEKQHNESPGFVFKVILSCTANLEETSKQILERHLTRTIFKSIIKLSTFQSSEKEIVPASQHPGVGYEIPCGDCEHKYVGKMKRSLSTRLKEHHRDQGRNEGRQDGIMPRAPNHRGDLKSPNNVTPHKFFLQ